MRRGRSAGPRRLWWRQLASEWLLASALVITTFMAALFASAAPRILEQASEDHLYESVAEAEPAHRNIRIELNDRVRAGIDDPFGFVNERGEEYRDGLMPASVQSVTGESRFVVDTPRFQVASFPDEDEGPFPTLLRLRFQQGIADQLEVVDGRLPENREPVPMLIGRGCPPDRLDVADFEPYPEVQCGVVERAHFEVAVTAQTADDMMLSVGDMVIVRADSSDILWHFAWYELLERRIVVSISGIIELTDADDDFWYGDSSLHRPRITENADYRIIHAVGVAHDDSYSDLLRAVPFVDQKNVWRYTVDPEALHDVDLDELRSDLDKIIPREAVVVSQLPRLIDEFQQHRAMTLRLISTVAIGIAFVGLAVVFIIGSLLAARQQQAMSLMTDRGASRLQVFLLVGRRSLVTTVPAAALGYFAASRLVPGTESAAPRLAACYVALAAAATVFVSGLSTARHGSASQSIRAQRHRAPRSRRLVVEAVVVVVAVAAVVLVRRRGMIDDPAGDTQLDLLLAITPSVVAMAVGLVVLRLLEPLATVGGALAARSRGASIFIGLRRVAGQSHSERIPSLVALLAVGIALYSSVVQTSLATAQSEHTWQVVGADYRITGHRLGAALPRVASSAPLGWEGIVARGVYFPDTPVLRREGAPRVELLVVDNQAYRRVLTEGGMDLDLVNPLGELDGPVGATDPSLPAIVSTDWWGAEAPEVGDTPILDLGRLDPSITVTHVVERFPALPADRPFVVVALAALERLEGVPALPTTVLYLTGSESDGHAFEAELDRLAPTARVASRREMADAVEGQPLAVWADRALRIAFWSAIVFAVITAVMALALTTTVRQRDLTYLRTMGLSRGQATTITTLEHYPAMLIAVLAGTGVGVAIAEIIAPALDLEILSGGDRSVDMIVAVASVGGAIAVFLGVLTVAIILSVTLHRRGSDARILRMGDD